MYPQASLLGFTGLGNLTVALLFRHLALVKALSRPGGLARPITIVTDVIMKRSRISRDQAGSSPFFRRGFFCEKFEMRKSSRQRETGRGEKGGKRGKSAIRISNFSEKKPVRRREGG